MGRPEVSAQCDATVDVFDLFTPTGAMALAVVVKQLFGFQRDGTLFRRRGAEIRPIDIPWPEAKSVMLPSDLFLFKPGADVVVAGTAVAPREGVKELDVGVRVGPVSKRLRVFGPRVWYEGALGMSLSPPQPFHRLPLMWEHAWGGLDTSNPKKLASEPRNPDGTGVASDPGALKHQPGPQIEDVDEPIRSSRTKPRPAGVAAIGPGYEPRLGYAGTYDQRWQDERMPLPPVDFDMRFNQVATPDLVVPGFLRGGEPVELVNIGAAGVVQFSLPRLAFDVTAATDSGSLTYRPVLDTVVLRPDEEQLELTYRSSVPLPRGVNRVRQVLVFEERVS